MASQPGLGAGGNDVRKSGKAAYLMGRNSPDNNLRFKHGRRQTEALARYWG